jgi:hypothetical protein
MAQYATASELASYLQQDLDTATANLVLTTASAAFAREADTAWTATTVTWSVDVGGCPILEPPYRPITAVSQVRLNGSIITGWSLRNGKLFRAVGFGYWSSWPRDYVDIDLTYGYTVVTDDVKGAVLETAAQAYQVPVGAVASEQIDDYAVRYVTAGGGLRLTDSAKALAAGYRGVLIG